MYINAALTLAQTLFSIFALFFSYKLIIAEIGVSQLGFWALLVSIVALTRATELGLSGSLLKYVSKYLANNEISKANYAVDSSTLSVGVLVAAAMIVLYWPIQQLVLYILDDPQAFNANRDIFILSFLTAWLAAIAGVNKLALEGCQRYDYSTISSFLSTITFVVGIILLVPKLGLKGLAYSIILQNLVLYTLCRMFLSRTAISSNLIPTSFSYAIWKEILLYGVKFQIISLLKILLEPLTKTLLGIFSSLEFIGFYELASKFVTQMRRLLVAMNQVLIPNVSEKQAAGTLNIPTMYQKNYQLVNYVSIYFFTALLFSIPLLETLWFGESTFIFRIISIIAVFAFFLNTLSVPAYMMNLGVGELKQNLTSHILMGVVNIVLGALLGSAIGGFGVVLGWGIALCLGTFPIVQPFHKKHRISITDLINRHDFFGIAVCLAGVAIFWNAFSYLQLYDNITIAFLFTTICALLLVLAPMWIHPTRKLALDRILSVVSQLTKKLSR